MNPPTASSDPAAGSPVPVPASPVRPIRFLHRGAVQTVADVPITRSVLEWLREDARCTGTKEGCAEGDCGACTVILARRRSDGRVGVAPCNACIRPLASVDGCGVLTVEGLGNIHPVQQAMREGHGSQCGFCTPGFVMAMAARLAEGPVTDAAQACEALAGNLCRCTGYRPILEALTRASGQLYPTVQDGAPDKASGDPADGPPVGLPDWIRALPPPQSEPLRFASGGARWFAPHDAREIDALRASDPQAWLLAGGTDIGVWVTRQLREPDCWIWLGAVPELQALRVDAQGIDIGAAVSLSEAFAALTDAYPQCTAYLSRFASPAIRASGTLVGNLANGSPIGDAAPLLIALDAVVVLRQAGGAGTPVRRELPLEALYRDDRSQDRAPGEWIERVRVPRRRPGQRLAVYKLSKRFEQDISAVSLAVSVVDAPAGFAEVRIALGGLAARVRRAPAAEAALARGGRSRAAFEQAGAALATDFSPRDDLRAGRDYRLAAAAGLLRRAWHAMHDSGAGPVSVEGLQPEGLLGGGGLG